MEENRGIGGLCVAPNRSAAYLAGYSRRSAIDGAPAARRALLELLAKCAEQDWLDCGRALVLRGDLDVATVVLTAAIAEYPDSVELALALAGTFWQTKQFGAAESLLRALLIRQPANVATTFLLAKVLKEQARMQAAATVMRSLFEHARHPTDIVIRAVELLDDCGSKKEAAQLCENEIAAGSIDPRLYAYAGMLEMQLGDFERARRRYLFALLNDPRAADWQCANGLAACQRYSESSHSDFALFRSCLQQPALSEKARASTLFALGKAHDDVAEFELATGYFRQANVTVSGVTEWSRKNWRRAVEARLDSKPMLYRNEREDNCVPVFVVGMPRSGTTVLAELLARHPAVCHRGELAWLPFLARQLALAGKPTRALLEKAAANYLAQIRQDDSAARWFIDKQPLNFMHVDLIAALFPNARVIYCERSGRDTALSIWMQYFAGAEENFAYDFSNIAVVMKDSARLMAFAQERHPRLIHRVGYEALTQDAAACVATLAEWLGLPEFDLTAEQKNDASVISTASLWQARQPVYTRSVGRWHAYAPYLPELLKFPMQ